MKSSNFKSNIEKVIESMENDWPYLEKLLQSLINCYPCYLSGNNGINAAQLIVKKELENCGFSVSEASVSENKIKNNKDYVKVEEWGKLFENYSPTDHKSLTGLLNINQKYQTLALNGHVDVEPVFEPSKWKYNNLWKSGNIINNKFYGRGSTDMLGGVAGMLFCLKHVLNFVEPKTNILFHSASDEEIGGNGTLKCLLDSRQLPNWTLIAEPTSLNICTSSLGFHHFKILCKGKAVHMSQSLPGQNAVDIAMEVYKRVSSLEETFSKAIKSMPEFKNSKINPLICGRIEGGLDPAVPAESCVIEGVVFSTANQNKVQVKKIFNDVLIKKPKLDAKITMTDMSFPGAVSTDNLVPKTILSVGKIFNYKLIQKGFPSPCDMRLYALRGIPTVIFGPGDLSSAHATDESLDRDSLKKFCTIFAGFLIKFWDEIS